MCVSVYVCVSVYYNVQQYMCCFFKENIYEYEWRWGHWMHITSPFVLFAELIFSVCLMEMSDLLLDYVLKIKECWKYGLNCTKRLYRYYHIKTYWWLCLNSKLLWPSRMMWCRKILSSLIKVMLYVLFVAKTLLEAMLAMLQILSWNLNKDT